MTFLHALGGIFSLILVVALGFVLSQGGWFSNSAKKLLPKLVTNISLPPYLACTIISFMPRDDLRHILSGTIPAFLTMFSLFALAWSGGKLLNISKRHFGLFCVCVSNPNTIFIGIPVNLALFGKESLIYVLVYYFASTSFFWTAGNYFISRDADRAQNGKSGCFKWQQILSAPMLGFLTGIFIISFNIDLPGFIINSATLVGDLTTPLALMFIGITLQGIGKKCLRLSRDMMYALAGRIVISPLVMSGVLYFFDLPELMEKVFIIQSSLPVIVQVAILSAYYDTDPDFGSIMVASSTILCVFSIPLYMCLL